MKKIPRQVDRKIADALRSVSYPWRIVKKRDHYFLYSGEVRVCCIGNNSSKQNTHLNARNIEMVRKFGGGGER